VINCFLHYMENEGHKVSRAEFEKNLSEKLNDHNFIRDIEPLIIAYTGYDLSKASELVMNKLVPLIPGEPWQRRKSDLSGR
jgi:hypothetical protein